MRSTRDLSLKSCLKLSPGRLTSLALSATAPCTSTALSSSIILLYESFATRKGSDPNLSNSLNPRLDVLVMLSSTAASLDGAAKLDQECLDAEKSVSINKSDGVTISHPELLQGRHNLNTSTQSPPRYPCIC